jgi:hypothetical protein
MKWELCSFQKQQKKDSTEPSAGPFSADARGCWKEIQLADAISLVTLRDRHSMKDRCESVLNISKETCKDNNV